MYTGTKNIKMVKLRLISFVIVSILSLLRQGHGVELFPFGAQNGDSLLPKSDDGFTSVTLSRDFNFFNSSYKDLFVNNNGGVSFIQGVTQFTPTCGPLSVPMIIPFWADVNTAIDDGNVYYRESFDNALLQKAVHDIKSSFPNLPSVTLDWLFIATWDKVSFFGKDLSSCNQDKRNTFQLILATDGFYSFALFYYDQITWSTGTASGGDSCTGTLKPGTSGTHAKSGFDYGDGKTFYSIPGSCSQDILKISEASNINERGKWVFKIDENVQSSACDADQGQGQMSEDENGDEVIVRKARMIPSYVPIMGHIPLQIKGVCLDNAISAKCVFYDHSKPSEVEGDVLANDEAVCLVPYLLATGRITVDFEVLLQQEDGTTREEIYTGFIYTKEPSDDKLKFSIDEANDTITITWDKSAFNEDERLNLYAVELTSYSSLEEKGVILEGLSNTGHFQGLLEGNGAECLKSIESAFALYLMPSNRSHRSARDVGTRKGKRSPGLYSGIHFTRYGKTPDDIARLCDRWHQIAEIPPSDVLPCPPLLDQAVQDRNFQYETLKSKGLEYYHPGAEISFVQRVPSPSGGGQKCVYKHGKIFMSVQGGGKVHRFSPKENYIAHQLQDVAPFYYCYKYNGNPESLRKYMERRPANSGERYRPPRAAFGAGDPHITTFDSLSYTFNGIGEFWMIKDLNLGEKNGKRFEMQARMEQYVNPETNVATNASIFTSFVFRSEKQRGQKRKPISKREKNNFNRNLTIQVSLVHGKIQTLFDTEEIDFDLDDEVETTFSYYGVSTTFYQSKTRVILTFAIGYTFEIWTTDGVALSIFVSAEPSLYARFRGLLGYFDGEKDNDLTDAQGFVLSPINASLEEIHYNFGSKWQTESEESLFFYYGKGKNHSYYQNIDFKPNLELLEMSKISPEIKTLCGNQFECLYDFVTTGNQNFANTSKNAVQAFEDIVESGKKEVVMCGEPEIPENGYFLADNFFVGSIATFHCNGEEMGEYKLEGEGTCVQCIGSEGRAVWNATTAGIKCISLGKPKGTKVTGNVVLGLVISFTAMTVLIYKKE